MKKSGSGRAKSGTGAVISKSSGKTSNSLPLVPKSTKVTKPTTGLIPNKLSSTPTTSGKSYAPVSYTTPKNAKSSTTFGIIWLPSRKHKKKKEIAYDSHRNDNSRRERGPSMYNFMSGDSHTGKKGEETERDLLVPEGGKAPAAIAGVSAVAAAADPGVIQPEENQEFISHEKDKADKACGDTPDDKKIDIGNLENSDASDKLPGDKGDKGDTLSDRVDSVYLRPPPPHKARSNASTPPTPEEDDCMIKCLYYTMQCCDCVLM